MMQWEAPLMEAHAARLCAAGGTVMTPKPKPKPKPNPNPNPKPQPKPQP